MDLGPRPHRRRARRVVHVVSPPARILRPVSRAWEGVGGRESGARTHRGASSCTDRYEPPRVSVTGPTVRFHRLDWSSTPNVPQTNERAPQPNHALGKPQLHRTFPRLTASRRSVWPPTPD